MRDAAAAANPRLRSPRVPGAAPGRPGAAPRPGTARSASSTADRQAGLHRRCSRRCGTRAAPSTSASRRPPTRPAQAGSPGAGQLPARRHGAGHDRHDAASDRADRQQASATRSSSTRRSRRTPASTPRSCTCPTATTRSGTPPRARRQQASGITEVGDCGYSSCLWDTPAAPRIGYIDRDYFRFAPRTWRSATARPRPSTWSTFDVDRDGQQRQLHVGAVRRVLDDRRHLLDHRLGRPAGFADRLGELQRGRRLQSCPAGNVDFSSTASGNSAPQDHAAEHRDGRRLDRHPRTARRQRDQRTAVQDATRTTRRCRCTTTSRR